MLGEERLDGKAGLEGAAFAGAAFVSHEVYFEFGAAFVLNPVNLFVCAAGITDAVPFSAATSTSAAGVFDHVHFAVGAAGVFDAVRGDVCAAFVLGIKYFGGKCLGRDEQHTRKKCEDKGHFLHGNLLVLIPFGT